MEVLRCTQLKSRSLSPVKDTQSHLVEHEQLITTSMQYKCTQGMHFCLFKQSPSDSLLEYRVQSTNQILFPYPPELSQCKLSVVIRFIYFILLKGLIKKTTRCFADCGTVSIPPSS
jgi:hypothetical protein